MNHPLDEPTTIDRHDIDGDPRIPHRHPDTDLRPISGFLLAVVLSAGVFGLLLLGYYWLIR